MSVDQVLPNVSGLNATLAGRGLQALRPAAQAMIQRGGKPISPVVLTGLVRFMDGLLIAVVGLIVHLLWDYPAIDRETIYFATHVAITFAAVFFFQSAKIYNPALLGSPVYQISRIMLAWTLVFLTAIAVAFFAKQQNTVSRVWVAGWYMGGFATLMVWRLVLAALVQHWTDRGRLRRRAVIVGGSQPGEALVRILATEAHSDIRVCGFFDDRDDTRVPSTIDGVPKLGTVDDLVTLARHTHIDLALISLPLTADERIVQIVRQLWVLPIELRLAMHMSKLRFQLPPSVYIGSTAFLPIFAKPIADWNLVLKSSFDAVVGALLLVVLSPLMLLIAALIKLDSPGPVLFRQQRLGFNNRIINVYKFRTLHHHHADPQARQVVTRGDPRVTRIGRFLRKTSLDELPQLFNVVGGDLSLVGPRPHAVHAPASAKSWEELVDEYFARQRVKPGMTGWAQINGWRGELDTQEKLQHRIEHDLYYIENWSLLFDILILIKTPFALLRTENAY